MARKHSGNPMLWLKIRKHNRKWLDYECLSQVDTQQDYLKDFEFIGN